MLTKLKIVNPQALNLRDTFGFKEERLKEISDALDLMSKEAEQARPLRLVFVSEIIQRIEDICETPREFAWALMNHIQWLYRTGRMIIPV